MTSTDNRPIIGITGPKGENYQEKLNLIAEKICLAGGIPKIISWQTSVDPQEVAQKIHGLVIGGGAHVPPENYGQIRRQDQVYVLNARFNFEKELYKILYNNYQQKPILGICYGMQALNVFADGKLDFIDHSHFDQHDNDCLNTFSINQGTFLNQIMTNAGDHSLSLLGKCNHAQCITTLGRDFTVSSWHNNIIGSIENTIDGRWIVGTQWHPERTENHEGNNAQIFKEFINRAKTITLNI
jgi:putative glutamine amidotransferase